LAAGPPKLFQDIEALCAEQVIVENGGFSNNKCRSPYQPKVSMVPELNGGRPFLQIDMQTARALLCAGCS